MKQLFRLTPSVSGPCPLRTTGGVESRRSSRPILESFLIAGLLALSTAFAPSLAAQDGGAREDSVDLERIAAIEEARIATVLRARSATVAVFSSDGRGGGSGVLLTPDGICITNYHVVKPCGPFMKCGLDDGQIYDAVIVGIDPTGDVAMIKLLGRDDFPTAELADSDQVRIGQPCFAIGNPFLLATNLQPTVTWGMVSGTHRYQYPAGTLLEYTDCIQTDASINPGNSGGPLFDAQGRVIGINGRISIEKRSRVNVGVGYAISSNQVRHFFGVLSSGRIVDHATLGATVETGRESRVIVDAILDNSEAFRRGLRYGDEVLEFGGRPIDTVNGFKNILGIFPKGWRVPLVYSNADGIVSTAVRLPGLHSREELISLVQGEARGEPEAEPEEPQPEQEASPHAAAEVPAEVAALYEARRGFANFHFNRLHQERLLAAYPTGARGARKLFVSLRDEEGGVVELALGPDTAAWRAGNEVDFINFEEELSNQLAPRGTGFLLAAYHWQRLIAGELRRTGEVIFEGTAPDGSNPDAPFEVTHDVLSATLESMESEFWFRLGSGELEAIELFMDDRLDACRIEFGQPADFDGQQLPTLWVVNRGGQEIGRWTVDSYRWEDAGAANDGEGQP